HRTAGARLRYNVRISTKEKYRKGRKTSEGQSFAAGKFARGFAHQPRKARAELNSPGRAGRIGRREEARRAGRIGKKSGIRNRPATRRSQGQGTDRSGICLREPGSAIGERGAGKT